MMGERRMHKVKVYLVVVLLVVILAHVVGATSVYHPTNNYSTSNAWGYTFDVRDSGGWWKAFLVRLPIGGALYQRTTIESRLWKLQGVPGEVGMSCMDRAIGDCVGGCSGPGRDVWVDGNTVFGDFAWITTRHRYRVTPGAPMQVFFTAATNPLYATASYFRGDESVNICPPSNNIQR